MNPDARTVLEFWFGELDDGFARNEIRRAWFNSDPARDDDIRRRFAGLLEAAARGALNSWRHSARESLALILVCDQFSRQIHRGRAAAFATDPLALEIARELVVSGADRELELDERVFVYLPFEHAESRLDQHTSVGLFVGLRDATPAGRRHLTGVFLQHAQQHRDIVVRFGRFPHRNAPLGRRNSAAEREFLADAGDFGQTPRGGRKDQEPSA